ncbi:MAG: Uma2 family endonuclease [Deltaproteobacteria bacterium]|nr:Uma2 family endonuclease [Deltaproteobacteria bacterium]
MAHLSTIPEPREPIKLNVRGLMVTDEQFELLCRENPELRLELTTQKELIIMPPTGFRTGRRNSRLGRHIDLWAEAEGTGVVCDSSTLFTLPNGAKRSPDVSWIRKERLATLSEEEQEGVLPLCPDFVLELRSPTDRLADLQEKMQEYIANGARLGWLIDPYEKRVHLYRPGQLVEVLDDPAVLNGDPILPGFVLSVRELW